MQDDHSTHTEADAGRFERSRREDDFYGTEQVTGRTSGVALDLAATLAALDEAVGRTPAAPAVPSRDDLLNDEAAAYYEGPEDTGEVGIRCGACKGRHETAGNVRWCYDLRAEARAEAEAEQAAEAASEVAFARSREAMAERGTWFGPVTEADSWGEEDDAAADQADLQRARNAVVHAGLASGEGDCEGGVCEDINRLCSKHQGQYQARYGRASNE